jgi:CheY-like chemotaxis protein
MMRRTQRDGPLEGLRVLLVEDVDDIRDLFAMLLRDDGAEVRAVGSAQAAIDTASTWTFDVLLTDLGLPDRAGDALIGEICRMKGGRVRVLVVTGFGEPYASLARQAGAEAVFTKPLDWAALRGRLAACDEALAA